MNRQAAIERRSGITPELAKRLNADQGPTAEHVRSLLWLQVQHCDPAGASLLRQAVCDFRASLRNETGSAA